MKEKPLFFIIIATLFTNHVQAQPFLYDVDELIAAGRDSVIKIAIKRLEESDFKNIDPDSFDRLELTSDGDDIRIRFWRSIQYVPMDTLIIHTAVVELRRGLLSWDPVGGTGSLLYNVKQFYTYTPEDLKAIDFVLESIPYDMDEEGTLIIYEHKDYYSIDFSNEFGNVAGYHLSKESGNISDEWHMMPNMEASFDDGFRPIDWKQD